MTLNRSFLLGFGSVKLFRSFNEPQSFYFALKMHVGCMSVIGWNVRGIAESFRQANDHVIAGADSRHGNELHVQELAA